MLKQAYCFFCLYTRLRHVLKLIAMPTLVGHISQIIGPVVDVYFEGKDIDANLLLPSINDALAIRRNDGRTLIVEVQQHIGIPCICPEGNGEICLIPCLNTSLMTI